MTASPATVRAAAELGAVAPPSVDGEPVFDEPWEGRAYGLALDLVERCGLPWSAFRDLLITAITECQPRPYYESWIVALERLTARLDLVDDADLARERAEVAAYRYDERGTDIEVVPLAHTIEILRSELGESVVGDAAAHVELFRVWESDAQRAWGVRCFDRFGDEIARRSLPHEQWEPLRDRLLSFARADSTPG
jgi:nitrile hydratase accessory protein